MFLELFASEAGVEKSAPPICAAGQGGLGLDLMNQFVFPDLCQGLGVVSTGG